MTRVCVRDGCEAEFTVKVESDRKKYCTRSCAAKVNNRAFPKREKEPDSQETRQCRTPGCYEEFVVNRKSRRRLCRKQCGASVRKEPRDHTYIKERVTVTKSGCWEWKLSLNPQTGYGQVRGYPYTAHKLAYKIFKGRYPNGVTRHTCHNRKCCNPDHLLEGTHRDNYMDSLNTHKEANANTRGRPARNRVPVVVNGVVYDSTTAAMQELRVSWRTLQKMIKS